MKCERLHLRDEELILSNRVVWKNYILTPGYIEFTSERGLEIFPFEKELPSASFVSGTIFILNERIDYAPIASLDFKRACEYIDSQDGWYDNASLTDITGKEAKTCVRPILVR